MRILIADDHLTSRTMLADILRKSGYDVVEAANGSEAWDVLQRGDAPRLVILDWVMPEMDGLTVVRKVRELKTEQPPHIIMLTVKGDKDDVICGLEAGADDYLPKPFYLGELRARVEAGRRMIDLQEQVEARILELRHVLEHVSTLQGILPICMHCKKIRDDEGYWEQVEAYISHHSAALFSHSICPECMAKYYPGV